MAALLVEGNRNKCWYRLRIRAVTLAGGSGNLLLTFQSTRHDAGRTNRSRMDSIISATEMTITTSGLILMPLVSSSKKRRRPALDAGNGASRFRFLLLKTVRLEMRAHFI